MLVVMLPLPLEVVLVVGNVVEVVVIVELIDVEDVAEVVVDEVETACPVTEIVTPDVLADPLT